MLSLVFKRLEVSYPYRNNTPRIRPRRIIPPLGQTQTGGLPVTPDLGLSLAQLRMPRSLTRFDARLIRLIGVSVLLGLAAACVAWLLMKLIGLITNLSFYGTWSTAFSSPAGAVPHLGAWVIGVPVIGGLIAGGMARWGSKAIR